MGIKQLNKIIKNQCSESLTKVHFSSLKYKKLAIDISIYLYKFKMENTLIESIYFMISLFRSYNIIPVFIFDGKPPAEKKELLKQRKEKKQDAEKRYNELQEELKEDLSKEYEQYVLEEMDNEKKNFVKIKHYEIEEVKNLIRLYGVTYYDAPGEAEELCALLLKKNIVDGCVSEDMDLFLYGCSKVYRYLSLANSTMVCYNTKNILNEFNCSIEEFKLVCILSGTDYYDFNVGNIYKCFHLFNKFSKLKKDETFYEWLQNNKIIDNTNDYVIDNIISMFDFSNIKNKLINNKYICKNISYNNSQLKNFMKNYGFIYMNQQ
jgi:flap endonuclease-1